MLETADSLQDSGQWALQSLSVKEKTMGRVEYSCLSSSRPGDTFGLRLDFSQASTAKGHGRLVM